MTFEDVTPKWHFVVLLALLILQPSGPAYTQSQPQVDLTGKNVLVLHAWEANLPMSTETNKGLSRVFNLGGIPAFNQSFECLDLRRNPGPEYGKLLVEKMRLQYGRRKPDLIIAVNPIAMRFATYDCSDVFADIPILALMLPQGFEVPKSSRRVISHFPSLDIVGTLDIALKLVPNAKRVYVACGSYETDIAFENQVRQLSKKWEGRLRFFYLSSMSFEDMLAAVSKVPPDSIILTLGFARDVSGKLLATPTAIRQLSQVSAAPVFGIADVALGYGIVGGFLSSYEFIGTKAGELALDILRVVKTPDRIPEVLDVPAVPMFDWRELRRWKLSEAALPKGSIVINKEPTLWDFRYYIIAALAFCVLETALIIFLMIQRRRKILAEASVREKTKELDQFFDVSLDLLGIANIEGYFLRLNPAVERILGYNREELMVKPSLEFVHPDDLDKTREALSALASQQRIFSFENRYRCKDGTYRWLQWSSTPVGTLIYTAARDVTEQKQAREELRRQQEHLEEMVLERTAELAMARDEAEVANRAKSTFLANMSHELRTPLNSILGIAQMMERDPGFPVQHRDTLKILSRSGAHLLDLINDVLEVSKIEARKMAPDITSFDLQSLLGDMEEMMSLRANQKGLSLLFEDHPSPPRYITTDMRKLRQVLINLLSNAIKFTEKGQVTLRIAVEKDGSTAVAEKPSPARLKFEVEDTGIGIALEDMKRIFEPFVQVNPARSAREGTGLGLTLSRMFIELLGGEITVRSQMGKGSVFSFDIPVKLVEGVLIRTQESDRQVIGLLPGQPHYRLLIVDDSDENRYLLRQLLEKVGFNILEASSGQEAIDLYQSSQPHLIWMDVRMPVMDGYETAQRIRETESVKREEDRGKIHTPIIALTAGVIEHQITSPLSLVFDDWVYKPFQVAEIFDMLEKHLKVQFIYQPSKRPAVETERCQKQEVSASDLAALPLEWLKEFFRVLRKGHSPQLIDLIGRISNEHADLAGTLTELVRVYRFDDLIVATEGALQEASNG